MQKNACWTDYHSYDETLEILLDLALIHAERSGPYRDTLCAYLHSRDWASLLDFELSYGNSDDPVHLINARQALAFFQKLEPLVIGEGSKTLEAFRKFAKTELECRSVNDRFCRYRTGIPMGYPWDAILVSAREKIARILGKAPALEELHFRFGPGAQTNVKKKDACSRVKLGVQLECSNELFPFARKVLAELPELARHHAERVAEDDDAYIFHVPLSVVPGKLQFVPKDAKKYRTITVEPGLNVLFQQGLGGAIRKRLRKAGVDLDTQDRNRYLAYVGSLSNQLATLDFSSASDTIATQMVAFLLPDDWFVLLALARTGTVTYNGLSIKLEKFSTMGNSFTFELESLIFYSLAWACLGHLQLPKTNLSIFGDDLIVPSKAVTLVECVFAFCGFTVNTAKSYSEGPFRESCGADYFFGLDIRPYYQKELVSAETLFTLHNHYVRTGEMQLAEYVRTKWIHPDLIIFGPDGYGDGHLIGSWDALTRRVTLTFVDSSGRKKRKRFPHTHLGWEGSYFKSFRHSRIQNRIPHSGDKLLPTYSIYTRDPSALLEEPQSSPISTRDMWADPKYLTVPGAGAYEVVFIYTLAQSVFNPTR